MMVSARIFLAFAVLGLATSATAFKPTLCDDSIIAGGFSPADPSSPDTKDVIEAIVDDFVALHNTTIPCVDYDVEPLQVCSQVVAGTNYEVLLHITCENSATAPVTVYGEAFVPLPSAVTQGIVVSEVEPITE